MEIRELLIKNADKQADELMELALKAGYKKQQVLNAAAKLRMRGHKIPLFNKATGSPVSLESGRKQTISVTQFIKDNDMYIFVENCVRKIGRGEMYEEATFVKTFLRGKVNYRAALESEEIKPFRGRAGGKWYLGNPEDIKDLKARGLLSN